MTAATSATQGLVDAARFEVGQYCHVRAAHSAQARGDVGEGGEASSVLSRSKITEGMSIKFNHTRAQAQWYSCRHCCKRQERVVSKGVGGISCLSYAELQCCSWYSYLEACSPAPSAPMPRCAARPSRSSSTPTSAWTTRRRSPGC